MHQKSKVGLLVLVGLLMLTACTKSTLRMSSSAETGLSTAVGKDPIDPTVAPDYAKAALVNIDLGLGYLTQGQVARAKTKLTRAVKLGPNVPETHSAMAYFLEMIGEYKDSEREHKKAIGLSGKGAMYNNYGAFLCRQNRFQEADQAFQHALQDKEYIRTAEVFENAGVCALKAKHPEKASEYLATAIRRDPSRANALLELASLNFNQGKLKEAKELLNRYRKVAEPSARSLWLGISISKALREDNNVASQALLLKNLFEDSPEYQLYLNSENDHS